MTTAKSIQRRGRLRLPDIPQRNPDEVTAYNQIHQFGSAYHLAQHFAQRGVDPETTLVTADHRIVADFASFRERSRYPDLLIAFEVDLDAFRAGNGYVIAEQGKPPDFALEVASPSTGRIDIGAKRDDYLAFGILEYWRFDETGEHHGARLAGDRLVDGGYVSIVIEELPDGSLEGYSGALDLFLRWQAGQLRWLDPATGRQIATLEDERAARLEADRRAEAEHAARIEADRRVEAEQARVRELEAELRRLRDG